MRRVRDKAAGTLKLSQEKYIKKVREKLNMADAKPKSTPLGSHLKHSLKKEEDKENMAKVSYASSFGSLMYAMVCTIPNIAHAVRVVSRFMSNLGKEH